MKRLPEQGHADKKFSGELPQGVKLLHTIQAPVAISTLAFDPKDGVLASGSFDGTVALWDAPSGKMLRTFGQHQKEIYGVRFDPQGNMLATWGDDRSIKLWDARSGKLLRRLEGHKDWILSVAFAAHGKMLASTSEDKVSLWETQSGKLVRTFEGYHRLVADVAFGPQGRTLATGGDDQTLRLWETQNGKLLHTLEGHTGLVRSLAFDRQTGKLASGSFDSTVKVWDTQHGKLLRTLEGHTAQVNRVSFSSDGRLLASKGRDITIRLWSCETWEMVATIPLVPRTSWGSPALAFHPTLPLLATVGGIPEIKTPGFGSIQLWELDYDILLNQRAGKRAKAHAVHHTTGKIVLVGDHSVGKSALGHRLIHGRFKEQASTHGQQFWVFPALGKRRTDDTECEAILWDFAGQPDYRLVHTLFVDDADLALVLFDASDIHDPLHGVGFWLKQLQTGQSRCPIILVAAQTDRGSSSFTQEELSRLPLLLQGRVHADFRDESAYFMTAFDLILSIYQFPPNHPAVADLRESLQPPEIAFRH